MFRLKCLNDIETPACQDSALRKIIKKPHSFALFLHPTHQDNNGMKTGVRGAARNGSRKWRQKGGMGRYGMTPDFAQRSLFILHSSRAIRYRGRQTCQEASIHVGMRRELRLGPAAGSFGCFHATPQSRPASWREADFEP